jgi:hypothetical protein
LAGGLTITLSSTKQKKRKSNKTEKMIVWEGEHTTNDVSSLFISCRLAS